MLTVTDATFSRDVLEATLPVIVDFWASWCGPCRALAPVLEEVAQALEGRVLIFSMDIDQNPETPSRYGIQSIPTLMLFQGGKERGTKLGIQAKENLISWAESFKPPQGG